MAISIITNFTANTPAPLDSRIGPYATVAQATSSIDSLFRFVGQTVIITGSGAPVEYWFYPTTANSDLVLKTATIDTSIFATTGSNQFNGSQTITGSLSNGSNAVAAGSYSHAEGINTIVRDDGGALNSGQGAHAEGLNTTSSGNFSHAEGDSTYAYGFASHAEGYKTQAIGNNSHAEGYFSQAIGNNSRAIGESTVSIGVSSHAGGIGTIASGTYQTVVGKYNKQNNTSSLFIIGNGTNDSNRNDLILFNSNSVELSGSLNISGSLLINGQGIPDASTFVTTSSFNAYTSSINAYTSSINAKTGSFVTTSSFNAFTSSVESSLNGKANLATGNSFTGDQSVSGVISSNTLFESKLATVTVLASDTTVLLEYGGNTYLGGSLDIHIEKDSSNFTLYNVIVSNDTIVTNSSLLVINSTSFGIDVVNNITIIADINGSRVRVKAINADSSNYSARIFPRLIKNQI